jgi:hypothetical protein
VKKSAIAAAALAGVTALAGGSALPGSASTDHDMRTISLVLHTTAAHELGKYTFAATDRATSDGEFVGYDTIFGRYIPKTNTTRIHVALALEGGIIVAKVADHGAKGNVITYRGRIVCGTGKFEGAHGTVRAHSPASDSSVTYETIRYHL